MTEQTKIAEIETALCQLKKIKRKMYCSEYYQQNRERILEQARFKHTLTSAGGSGSGSGVGDKNTFKIEKKAVVVTFD